MLQRYLPILTIVALLLTAGVVCPALADDAQILTLCYHDISDDGDTSNSDAVQANKFVEQLNWLQEEGYQAISLNDLLAARAGQTLLPAKPVLLTFDDGYESFYTRVYPILRAYHFPAVLGIDDAWMNNNPRGSKSVGNSFLTWEQIREMQHSGLVEVASRTHDLNKGIDANSDGNEEPAATTMLYGSGNYETSESYKQRLDKDMDYSVRVIAAQTGHRPRAIMWPYGAYNRMSLAVADAHGMTITMSLDDGLGSVNQLMNLPRYSVTHGPIADFVADVRNIGDPGFVRVVQIDLDYVYDANPAQMARNLDALVQRIHDMHISTVFLQAFADPTGSGVASALYFPNHYLPMRADLLNHVAWQLKKRAGVKVFGWLPVLSFNLNNATPVTAMDPATGQVAPDPKAYHRLSPFDPQTRKIITGIYEDMARDAPIDGLLFHDDAVLSDYEDASPMAMDAYRSAGLPTSIQSLRADPQTMKKWTDFKTDSLIKFTENLAAHARLYRMPLLTARNIYAPVVLNPDSEAWFAQNYDRFLQAYDYTAIMAMPQMENVADDDADEWLQKLYNAASYRPDGLKHTIFELQAVDWRKSADTPEHYVSAERLGEEMRLLEKQGAMNFGYYPDNFVTNEPDASALHKDFSLQSDPFSP